MNILKPDSPVMNLLSTIADLIIVHILFIICSIPVVTFGAAYSAKYYVAMKIIRGEGTGVIKPFFTAFAKNFKQATAVWLILLVGIALIILDWRWIIYNGWANTGLAYKIGIIAFSIALFLMTMAIFPVIARYKMKTLEVFKAALILAIVKIIPLSLIGLLFLGSIVACLWYAQWFPLVYAFTSTTITYFMCLVFIKQFDKLEKARADELKALKESVETNPELDAAGNISLAGAKKDVKALEKNLETPDKVEDKSGNRFTRFIRTEKAKLRELNGKQKAIYLCQYYLPGTVLVILFVGAVCWYSHDIYKSSMRVLGGGLINCTVTDEGRDYATKGFLEWGGYGKKKTAELIDTELGYGSVSEYEEKYLEVAFRSQIVTGTFDYVIMRDDVVWGYSTTDYFMDMNDLVNMDNFTSDDFYYYEMTDAEKTKSRQGISFQDLFKMGAEESDEPVPVALKLTDEAEKKLGLDEEHDYYIGFAYSIGTKGYADYVKFIEYLFGKC